MSNSTVQWADEKGIAGGVAAEAHISKDLTDAIPSRDDGRKLAVTMVYTEGVKCCWEQENEGEENSKAAEEADEGRGSETAVESALGAQRVKVEV